MPGKARGGSVAKEIGGKPRDEGDKTKASGRATRRGRRSESKREAARRGTRRRTEGSGERKRDGARRSRAERDAERRRGERPGKRGSSMRKRIIATLMALCMALSLLPVQVLATEGAAQKTESAEQTTGAASGGAEGAMPTARTRRSRCCRARSRHISCLSRCRPEVPSH